MLPIDQADDSLAHPPAHISRKVRLFIGCLTCLLAFGWTGIAEAKVSATIILATVEGEVKALSLDENFEMILDESSVGKTVDENFIVTTGKDGKAVFLFSNGVLATIKPNSRLYVREFVQESFKAKSVPPPVELKEEPSTSHLKFHLDFGDMVVKAPKLNKSSSLVLTSPVGTAGIRGTMFQMVVARDPDTGTVSGGVNLISGDVEFTDVSGTTTNLASGQGMEVYTRNLGDSAGSLAGELRDLTAKFGPVLAGTGPFPKLDFPEFLEALPPGGPTLPDSIPPPLLGFREVDDWGAIHEIATATFFAIEEAEEAVRSFTFAEIEDAVSVTVPTPALTAPAVPGAFTGGSLAPPDSFYGGHPEVNLKGSDTLTVEMGEPFVDPGISVTDFSGADQTATAKLLNPPNTSVPGTYKLTYTGNDFRGFETAVNRTVQVIVTPPVITLNPGSYEKDFADGTTIYHSVRSRNPVSFPDAIAYVEPGFSARDYAGRDLTGFVTVEGPTVFNNEVIATYTYVYTVGDKETRGFTLPDGTPVTTSVTRSVQVDDLTPPRIQLFGEESLNVEAATPSYTDAGAEAIDNYDGGTTLIPTSNNINLIQTGTYSVLYDFTDSRGNVADTVKRTVNVVDTTLPVIELYGQTIDFVDLNSTYKDVGAYATDTLDGDLTEKIVVTDPIPQAIADKNIGTHYINYDVTDGAGNSAITVSRTIVVLGNDGKGPQIELLGDSPLYLEVGTSFVEPGAVAFKDLGDGRRIDYEVVNISGTPNMNQLGSTEITYRAEDEFGNSLTTTRTVVIRDSTPPVIYPNKSNGQTDLSLEAGSSYTDDGAIATDNFDGDLTSKIVSAFREKDVNGPELDVTAVSNLAVFGFVDPNKQYEVLYSVSDESNNTGSNSRTLTVYDTTPPTISFVLDPDTGEIPSLQGNAYSSDGGKTITIIGDTTEILFDQASIGPVQEEVKGDGSLRPVITHGAFAIKDTSGKYPIWPDAGVVATDNAVDNPNDPEQKLKLLIPTPTAVATNEAGVSAQYRVTYQASDAMGNFSEVLVRTIKVLQGPRVTLTGAAEIMVVGGYNETESITYLTGYEDAEATAQDALGNDLTNATEPGVGISVEYTSSIYNGSTFAPGPTGSLKDLGEPFDSMTDGDIDLTKTGKYEIFYKATDPNLNQSPEPQVSRVVYSVANDIGNPGSVITITPREQPGLQLNGTFWEVTHEVNATGYGSYIDPGAVAHKTRHAGLGPPYEEKQTWDENNASSEPTSIEVTGVVPFKLSVVNKYGGNKTPAFSDPYVVKYSVTDEFKNPPVEAELRVYVVDEILPNITPNLYPSTPVEDVVVGNVVNPTIEANATFADPGFTPSDNYWDTGDLITETTYYDKNKQETTINNVKTWNLDDFATFYVRYEVWDKSENYRDFNRTVTVEDTTAPSMTLNPVPSPLPVGSLGSGDLSPIRVLQDLSGADPVGASNDYVEHGLTVTDNSIDPTSYPLTFVPNPNPGTPVGIWSETQAGITVEIDASAVNMEVPGEYTVTYTVADSSGNVTTVSRTVAVLDKEKPLISASVSFKANEPPPSPLYSVVAEGGVQYDDDSGQTVKLWNESDDNITAITEVLTLTAADTQDGVITSRVARTINGKTIKNNDIASVPSLIDTSVLDALYEIKYDVNDTVGNAADSLYRHVIVKDTLPPTVQFSGSQTVLVDVTSKTNPNVWDIDSVEAYMLLGVTAVDANNFDQNLGYADQFTNKKVIPNTTENKWKVDFDPAFIEGAIYPETRGAGQGYKVTISVRDYSGNESGTVIRYLQVGDFTPPILTMMGKSEIHDFFRFGENNSTFPPSPSRQTDEITGIDHNSTGFGGGAHRMMLAEYNFTDPGAYAEDGNASWNIANGFPDLDGDGIGETYALVSVNDRSKMESCSQGREIIHVYSSFEKTTVQEWQAALANKTYGFPTDANGTGTSSAKIPITDLNNSGLGYAYTVLSKDVNASKLVNLDMTEITIEYRIKDGWDNASNIANRKVFIYESQQYKNYAFYATPLSTINGPGDKIEGYHRDDQYYNDVNSTPYMTSMRKDYDGDGVSDYWEAVFNTNPNVPESPGYEIPWNNLKNIDRSVLKQRINTLSDASLLKDMEWLRGFNNSHILSNLNSP